MTTVSIDDSSTQTVVAAAATRPEDVPALELRGIRAAYGRIEVLRGVDLVVPAGSVFALLGPNGAGKSTTQKVVNGRLKPTAGCVHIGGVHVNGASTAKLARAGVCSIPEGRGVFPNLTVLENLLTGAMLLIFCKNYLVKNIWS